MVVATIDFDIIMAPIIELYNGEIDDNVTIDFLIKQFPYLENIPADLNIYAYLTDFLTKVIKRLPSTNIKFIKSHEEIVPFLDDKRNIELINIDHHHDVGYDIDNWSLPLYGLNYDCGNWVKRLTDGKVLSEYIWVHTDKSESPDEEAEPFITEDYNLRSFNLNTLAKRVDALYICGSFEWVPTKYQPLFDTWKSICTNYYNTPQGFF